MDLIVRRQFVISAPTELVESGKRIFESPCLGYGRGVLRGCFGGRSFLPLLLTKFLLAHCQIELSPALFFYLQGNGTLGFFAHVQFYGGQSVGFVGCRTRDPKRGTSDVVGLLLSLSQCCSRPQSIKPRQWLVDEPCHQA